LSLTHHFVSALLNRGHLAKELLAIQHQHHEQGVVLAGNRCEALTITEQEIAGDASGKAIASRDDMKSERG
jgi:hypothetical protein